MTGKMSRRRNWLRRVTAVVFSIALLGGGIPVKAPAAAQGKQGQQTKDLHHHGRG